MLPPPRHRISTSHSPRRPASPSIAAICAPRPRPAPASGTARPGCAGMRRRNVVSTSRSAAPAGEVTTPMRAREARQRALALRARTSPSASSLALSRAKRSNSTPSPARRMKSTVSWNSPRASYSAGRGAHLHLHAVGRAPVQRCCTRAEHDAADLRALVLQREVAVPGRRAGEVGDLPGDPQQRQRSARVRGARAR